MLRIAICDDEEFWLNEISNRISECLNLIKVQFYIETFANGENLITNGLSYDVVFLDVQMNNINGIEIGEIIRKTNKDLLIVFVSAIIDYAPKGYQVDAFRYLLKVSLNDELPKAIDDIIRKLNINNQIFKFKQGTEEIEIPLNNILYFEILNRKLLIHTINYDIPVIEINKSLTEVISNIDSSCFVKAQKSYLVNMCYILQIKNYFIYLINGINIKASQKNYKSILDTYTHWKGEN